MSNMDEIIATLTKEHKVTKQLPAPSYWVARLLAVFVIYGAGAILFMGIRPNFAATFADPWYLAETGILAALILSSLVASVTAMYPDSYRHRHVSRLPYMLGISIMLLLLTRALLAPVVTTPGEFNSYECTLCIASLALVPSALLLRIIARGASVHPLHAGAMAVLASAAIGCLTLRLAEDTDVISHLITYHYLPTLLFAVLGAAIGKRLLKW